MQTLRRFRRWPSVRTLATLLLIAFASGWIVWRRMVRSTPQAADVSNLSAVKVAPQFGACRVVRVIDGDTLDVEQRFPPTNGPAHTFRIRLLGVNTPETKQPGVAVEPWGSEAAEFTANLLVQGEVRLELDRRRVDRYGRFLAYVYVGELFLNEELLRSGLARRHDYPGDSFSISRLLSRAAEEAKHEKRGIWSAVE